MLARLAWRALVALGLLAAWPPGAQGQGTVLRGIVRDSLTGAPVQGARVALVGTARAALTDTSGAFVLRLRPGASAVLRTTRVGFRPAVDTVSAATSEVVQIALAAVGQLLANVIVTPGAYGVLGSTTSAPLAVTREELATTPQLGEDLLRALARLPGASGSDFSARLRIRNGGVDEQLHLLDGMELIEPFHLRDFDGALSLLDVESVGSVLVTAGGFTSRFGNRMTGVLDVASAEPAAGRARSAVGVSVTNVRLRTEGQFGDGRGAWVLSGRRGFLDLALRLAGEDEDISPTYGDLFGKLRLRLTDRHTLTLHGLGATDRVRATDFDGSTLQSQYGNGYLWARVASEVGASAHVTTLLGLSRLTWARDVVDLLRSGTVEVPQSLTDDTRWLQALTLKQDWAIPLTGRLHLDAGAELRSERAHYDYDRREYGRAISGGTILTFDSTRTRAALTAGGVRLSAYAALRTALHPRVVLETGLRSDRHAWTREATVSPRVHAVWTPREGTAVRGTVGHYHQAHTLQDLSVVDGDTLFQRAARATHVVAGVEQRLLHGWQLRVEAYERRIRDGRARFINVDGTSTTPIPESQTDRVAFAALHQSVRGVEISSQVQRAMWRASASVAWERARARVDGQEVPRPFDEPLSATADVSWRPAPGWTLAFAWTQRSGWPVGRATYALDTIAPGRVIVVRQPVSPVMQDRFAGYARLDFRATRTWHPRSGTVRLWVDLFNLLGRENPRVREYSVRFRPPAALTVTPGAENFLGRLPTAGVSWEF